MLRPKPSHLASAVLLLSALGGLGCSEAAEAGARKAITLDVDSTAVGELPAGFSTAVTGGGGPAAQLADVDVKVPANA